MDTNILISPHWEKTSIGVEQPSNRRGRLAGKTK